MIIIAFVLPPAAVSIMVLAAMVCSLVLPSVAMLMYKTVVSSILIIIALVTVVCFFTLPPVAMLTYMTVVSSILVLNGSLDMNSNLDMNSTIPGTRLAMSQR